MRFKNKKVVVAGGGGGMGRAMCVGFAKEGADVAVIDFVSENAKRSANEVKELGRRSIALQLDVANFKASQDCIKKVYDEFKRIDILVNAFGYAELVPFAQMTEETWDRSIGTHLKGVFNLSRAVINGMISQGYGRIISVSSLAGVAGTAKHVQYSAAKAGVVGFTKALAKEVAGYGITVNAFAPGITETPFLDKCVNEPALLEHIKKATLVGRMGKPEEMAALCLFLASDEAAYITGETININGGQYMA
jgi:3-oxoacyl-[acyl-carrier protein] reductase